MLSLAVTDRPWPKPVMTVLKDREAQERRRKGLALKALRRRLGITQERAAADYGATVQAWQLYEQGKRHFSDPKLAKLLAALGANVVDFELELAKIPDGPLPHGVREAASAMQEHAVASTPLQLTVGGVAHGGGILPNVYDDGQADVIDFSRYFAPGTRVLRLDGMSMYPYAEPGGFVTYNPRHPAKRGEGCVIAFKDGAFAVKRFERFEGDQLVVVEVYPVEQELRFPLADVAGVYAIGLRGA
jgi:transcriptional regulator with XRE-family HTH domain